MNGQLARSWISAALMRLLACFTLWFLIIRTFYCAPIESGDGFASYCYGWPVLYAYVDRYVPEDKVRTYRNIAGRVYNTETGLEYARFPVFTQAVPYIFYIQWILQVISINVIAAVALWLTIEYRAKRACLDGVSLIEGIAVSILFVWIVIDVGFTSVADDTLWWIEHVLRFVFGAYVLATLAQWWRERINSRADDSIVAPEGSVTVVLV